MFTGNARWVLVFGMVLGMALLAVACEDKYKEIVQPDLPDSGSGDSDTDGDGDDDDDTDTGSSCEPNDNLDEFDIEDCEEIAPVDSFDPVEEWTWTPTSTNKDGLGPPLVVNMTDDNGDGSIDMCDKPDVVVVAGGEDMNVFGLPGVTVPMPQIHVLDGATGQLHFTVETPVSPYTAPAVGDIDNDGLPEIVVPANLASILEDIFNPSGWQGLCAFEHDGTKKWCTEIGNKLIDIAGSLGITLADLDNNGSVEVITAVGVYDGATGTQIWSQSNSTVLNLDGLSLATIAADLDGDKDLEVITGTYAFHHDGSTYYDRSDLVTPSTISLVDFIAGLDNLIGMYPLVANLDGDPQPEIVIAGGKGIFVLEHDGATKASFEQDDDEGWFDFDFSGGEFGPASIHDFDGDELSEICIGTTDGLIVFNGMLEPVWSTAISAKKITLGATAFDFLGDGTAEAIYSDETEMLVFDGKTGEKVMSWPRRASNDYPIVADVDDDKSAEIIFVNKQFEEADLIPTLMVIGDVESRWIPTRRVWNQHSYHVTNVSEDGTIPTKEPPNWEFLNTFRTNVQQEGEICDPIVIE